MYLGRESMNASVVRTYAMPRMKLMLEQNAPWSQLVSLRNIALTAIFDKTPVKLADDITVEPFLVPHRDEFSETVGFRITARGQAAAGARCQPRLDRRGRNRFSWYYDYMNDGGWGFPGIH